MPIPALLITPVAEIIKSVVTRILPAEKISEIDRLKLESETTAAIMAYDWQQIEAEYKDRSNARALAEVEIAKGNAFTGLLAAIVRPVWGLGAFTLVAYSLVSDKEISVALDSIIQTVLMFYFGGRTIEKIAPLVTSAMSRKS